MKRGVGWKATCSLAVVLTLAGLFAVGITSILAIRHLLVANSDVLLAADCTHNLLSSPGTVASFHIEHY